MTTDGSAWRPSVDEALAIVRDAAAARGSVAMPVEQACGYRLAAPVSAAHDSPCHALSAMDGFALRTVANAGDAARPIAAVLDQRSHVLHSLVASDHWLRVDVTPAGITQAHRFPRLAARLRGDTA